MTYTERYQKWLNSPKIDEETRKELVAIKDDDNEIKERFIKIWNSEQADSAELSAQATTE